MRQPSAFLERFAQDTSQGCPQARELVLHCTTRRRERTTEGAAALADAITSAVGAEHADKLGGFAPLFQSFLLPLRRFDPERTSLKSARTLVWGMP
jgi:hypothetical protein